MFKMIKGHKKVTPLVGRAVHETKSLCFFLTTRDHSQI